MEEIILLIDFDVEFTQKQGITGNYVQLSKAFKKTIFADLHKFQTMSKLCYLQQNMIRYWLLLRTMKMIFAEIRVIKVT